MIRRHGFLFTYSLARRATCWRDSVQPLAGIFPEKRKHNVLGTPALCVEVYADIVRVELEYEYSSGHMWNIEPERVVAETGGPHWRRELSELIARADLDRIAALKADPGALGPGRDPQAHRRAVLGLFTPRRDREPDAVKPADATVYELGRSASGDGKVPYLTARLARDRIELALDHSFTGRDRQRRIEVLESWPIREPGDAAGAAHAALTERMGVEIADAAVFFYEHLGEMFA